MQFLTRILFLKFFVLALFISCNDSEQPENKEENAVVTAPVIKTETKEKINYVINDIPSPIEVAIIIKEVGLLVNTSLVNPLVNAGHYSSNNLKSFNLGVYGADLSYLVEYSQSQMALKYLGVCKQIADEMGISSAIDKELITAFEKNIDNKDSLVNLIFPAYKRIDDYLRSNERAYMGTLVLAGGFVEGMYFATQLIADTPKNEKNELLYQKLEEQRKVVNRLLELLKERKDDGDFARLALEFVELQNIYNSAGKKGLTETEISKLNKVMLSIRNQMVLK